MLSGPGHFPGAQGPGCRVPLTSILHSSRSSLDPIEQAPYKLQVAPNPELPSVLFLSWAWTLLPCVQWLTLIAVESAQPPPVSEALLATTAVVNGLSDPRPCLQLSQQCHVCPEL